MKNLVQFINETISSNYTHTYAEVEQLLKGVFVDSAEGDRDSEYCGMQMLNWLNQFPKNSKFILSSTTESIEDFWLNEDYGYTGESSMDKLAEKIIDDPNVESEIEEIGIENATWRKMDVTSGYVVGNTLYISSETGSPENDVYFDLKIMPA